eukprot:TRINITY_DN41846_c0_g1_i1.p2 TRINITY_DN41846_c0_g1~~TRINITY_DN41846_c0_g1_i1.p2  ORF type:complete len:346 (-),score=12.57 TRINITY_DN41846_c0_g1_i1:28-1065(-)
MPLGGLVARGLDQGDEGGAEGGETTVRCARADWARARAGPQMATIGMATRSCRMGATVAARITRAVNTFSWKKWMRESITKATTRGTARRVHFAAFHAPAISSPWRVAAPAGAAAAGDASPSRFGLARGRGSCAACSSRRAARRASPTSGAAGGMRYRLQGAVLGGEAKNPVPRRNCYPAGEGNGGGHALRHLPGARGGFLSQADAVRPATLWRQRGTAEHTRDILRHRRRDQRRRGTTGLVLAPAGRQGEQAARAAERAAAPGVARQSTPQPPSASLGENHRSASAAAAISDSPPRSRTSLRARPPGRSPAAQLRLQSSGQYPAPSPLRRTARGRSKKWHKECG